MISLDKQRASKAMNLHVGQQIAMQTWREHTMDLVSAEHTETYEGLGDFPAVEKYLKERNYQVVGQRDYTVKSEKWTINTELDVDDMKREKGMWFINTKIPQMAQIFAAHPNGLFFDVLQNTTSTNTMDRVTFFNAAHPVIGSDITNSNLVSGTGVAAANIKVDWYTVKHTFGGMKLRSGDRIFENTGRLSFEIFVPNALEQVFTDLFIEQRVVGDATTGTLRNANAKISVFDRLTDANDWYVKIRNFPAIQPFFFFKNYNPKFEWNDSKHLMFERDVVRYGGKARYAIVYAYPEIIIKVVNA